MDYMPIILVAVNAIIALAVIYLALSGKVNLVKVVADILDRADTVLKAVDPLLKPTPLGKYLTVIEAIEGEAEKGIHFAQHLLDQDPSVDRVAKSTEYVHHALSELGIELNDRIQFLVDGTIKAAIYVLENKPKS